VARAGMGDYHDVQWDQAKISRLWGWYAANLSGTYLAKHSGHRIVDYVQRVCDLRDKRIVDFGCGAGFLFEHVARRLGPSHTRYIGVDFSEAAIDTLRKRLEGAPGFVDALHARVLPVDMPSSQADVVFCVEVVEHLDDDQLTDALREVSRLLVRSGVVVVTTPNQEDLTDNTVVCPECGCVFHRWQHVRSWSASSLTRRMEAAGFITSRVAETRLASWSGRMLYRLRAFVRRVSIDWPELIYVGTKR
jgi:2-polyprenyl-3-methyl-5-hydroxy-6-metoxy-1,4-benzoquinol methylase